jgi:hypothetical protein
VSPPRAARGGGSTPPPLRSSPPGASQWVTPLKPIGAFRGPVAERSPGPRSPTAAQLHSAGRRSSSPGYSKRKTPPAPPPAADSSDEENLDAYDESSDEDGTGTLQQQEGKRARRERRRAHQEFMRRIRAEKKGIHERVHAAIFKCDDVLNDDLEAQKEVANELRESVQEIVENYKVLKSRGIEELVTIKFSDHSETVKDSQPSVDLDDFKVDDVNDIFNKMSSSRDSVESKAHLMIDMAIAMVNNDDSKQLLHDQQVRFVDEVNTLVKSLERVESHAKGLTQNNIDLRLQLRQAQEEGRDWKRKFEKIENAKDSMSRQMEAAIFQRTQALKSTMSGASGDEMSGLMDQLTQIQEHTVELKTTISELRREVRLPLPPSNVTSPPRASCCHNSN